MPQTRQGYVPEKNPDIRQKIESLQNYYQHIKNWLRPKLGAQPISIVLQQHLSLISFSKV
jgi:hypothetical protein